MVEVREKMTLEDKASYVTGLSMFRTKSMPQYGIPAIYMQDCAAGLNFEQLFSDFALNAKDLDWNASILTSVTRHFFEPEKLETEEERKLYAFLMEKLEERCLYKPFQPSCFPAGILMGATFNPEVVRRAAEAVGREAAAYGVHLLLGTPYANLMREPLNGRLFEGYSEDPYHNSVMAPAVVEGVQSQGVAADVKHYAANSFETNRQGIDEIMTKRALMELYLPAFRACVKAGVATVMSAYNRINGVACTENEWLLKTLLCDEWGFDGLVISDWGAVYNLPAAVAAGNHLAMPGPIDEKPIIEAVKDGSLSETLLDECVDHILEFEEKYVAEREPDGALFDDSVSDAAAYDAALEGIVMLKNENGIFPLDGSVSLYGIGAKGFYNCGTGSAGVTTGKNTILLDELQRALGEDKVRFEADDCDTLLVVVRKQGMEGNDRKNLFLDTEEETLLRACIAKAKAGGKKIGLILNVCGPVDIHEFEPDIDGIFCVFLPGMQGARALAALLVGRENPSGKLPVTFPIRYEDTPTYLNFPGDGMHTIYGEDIFVGYRYYDTKKMNVLYPFAHGLSYTEFRYSNIRVQGDYSGPFPKLDVLPDGTTLAQNEIFSDTLRVDVDVTNTGTVAGKEVVGLYVHDVQATLRMPEKQLKAFEKISLMPGETKTVTFTITKDMLASFDMNLDRWESEEGYFDILIGASAADIRLTKRVYGAWKSPYSYSMDCPLKKLYEHKELHGVLVDLFAEVGVDFGAVDINYEYTPIRSVRNILKEHKVTAIPEKYEKLVAEYYQA